MVISEHAWVIDVLQGLVEYAELSELPEIRDHCQLAYETTLAEVGSQSAALKGLRGQRHFVDSLRNLIDYSENANLPRTQTLLVQALTSAAAHLDGPVASKVVQFPGRTRH